MFDKMRVFHNLVKMDLLKRYTSTNITGNGNGSGKKSVNGKSDLLDLSCGKGGDLPKWYKLPLKSVIGFDIDQESIIEANKRLKIYKKKNPKKRLNISFYGSDLSKEIIKLPRQVSTITSMFAFHYFFKDRRSFDTIMATVNLNLKKGGYFIGCMFDGARLLAHKNTKPEQFYTHRYNKANSFFGNKIRVYLKNTVLDKPTDEYIVNFDKLVKKMYYQFNFRLVESEMFEDLFPVLSKDIKLSPIEKECSYLNRTFVFQKM